jgi:glucan endo-1,3-beta-D-glucosidase
VSNELTALKSAIKTHGTNFTDLVAGISVGSEDLYRITPTAIANNEKPGTNITNLLTYIARTREAVKDTALSHVPIGHVDTWTEWADPKNRALVDAVDFVGIDAYSYWQNMVPNGVDKGKALFDDALNRTRMAVGGLGDRGRNNKPVWVTETGFPVSGNTSGQAVLGLEGARRFWREVGCGLFAGEVNVWW